MVGMHPSIKLPKAFRHYWDTGPVCTPHQDCCLFLRISNITCPSLKRLFSVTLILRWHELHNHHARSLEVLWMLRNGGAWVKNSFPWFHVVSYLQSFQSDLAVCIIKRCFFRRLFCWKRSSELRFSRWKALVRGLECRWGCGPMLRATLTSALLISAVAVDELTKAAAKGVRGNCKDSGVQWSRGVKHGAALPSAQKVHQYCQTYLMNKHNLKLPIPPYCDTYI